MKIALFYHSMISDWNYTIARTLRGITSELTRQGHQVQVLEPRDGWSYQTLLKQKGIQSLKDFLLIYPDLRSKFYDPDSKLDKYVKDMDLIIVHERTPLKIVRQLGWLRQKYGFTLLFHDTHHRSLTNPKAMDSYDLAHYDGVLTNGELIKKQYLKKGWNNNVWVWHEAADLNIFRLNEGVKKQGDVVWMGQWPDPSHTKEIEEYLIKPVHELNLKANVYGVNFSEKALKLFADNNIQYKGYLPQHQMPYVYASHRIALQIHRKPIAEKMKGIPTVQMFEALACGIPLINSPWNDTEKILNEGKDFLIARNGQEMAEQIKGLITNLNKRLTQRTNGLIITQQKHNCSIRAKELLGIYKFTKEAIAQKLKSSAKRSSNN